MSDADGPKFFNDKFGYDAGNALLRAKADALKSAGLEAYHEKGDEFLYRGTSTSDLQSKLESARQMFRNMIIEATLSPTGSKPAAMRMCLPSVRPSLPLRTPRAMKPR